MMVVLAVMAPNLFVVHDSHRVARSSNESICNADLRSCKCVFFEYAV